jgi:hypothetical protein
VAADGQCYDASECAGDSSCGTESACPATCKAKSPASGACQYDEDCAFGTRCASDGQTGTCVARTAAAETQPCRGAADTECEPQLYCEGGSNTDSGTCKKRVSTGACAERDACELKQYCAGYDPPNTATGTCTAQKTSGQDCTGSGGEGFGSSECEPFTSCVGGKCTVWPGVDGQCGKVNDNYIGCLESWCDAPEDPPGPGTCRAYKKAGDACNPQRGGDFFGGGECGSGSCDQATSKCVESCLLRQP